MRRYTVAGPTACEAPPNAWSAGRPSELGEDEQTHADGRGQPQRLDADVRRVALAACPVQARHLGRGAVLEKIEQREGARQH